MYVKLRSPKHLRDAMDAAGAGFRPMGRKLGISSVLIHHLASGRNKGTTLARARAISDELGVPMRKLWRLEDIEYFLPSID